MTSQVWQSGKATNEIKMNHKTFSLAHMLLVEHSPLHTGALHKQLGAMVNASQRNLRCMRGDSSDETHCANPLPSRETGDNVVDKVHAQKP